MTGGVGPRNALRHDEGFTLIEVMIALALLAVVLALVQGVYSGVIRSRDFIQGRTERSHEAALLLHRMADELASTVAPPEGSTHQDEGFVLDKDGNLDSTLEFSALLPPVLQASEVPGASESGGVARIGYHLEKAEDGSLNLVRTDSRVASKTGASQVGEGDGADVLLRGISRFRVKVLVEGDTWQETFGAAGSTDQSAPPREVSIEVAWKEGKKGEGSERMLRTAVPLYANLEQP